jgi:GNAT superfamily N-acetyltransferase
VRVPGGTDRGHDVLKRHACPNGAGRCVMRRCMSQFVEGLRYTTGAPVSVDAFRELLVRSGLAARRPVEDSACLEGMLRHANLIVTCWSGDGLVGMARSVTDFHYCCYLSDLAVDVAHQGRGVGTTLIRMTQAALGPRGQIILLSAPGAIEYYPRIGFERHPQAWILPRGKEPGKQL